MQSVHSPNRSLVIRSGRNGSDRFDPYDRRTPRVQGNHTSFSNQYHQADIDDLISERGGLYYDTPSSHEEERLKPAHDHFKTTFGAFTAPRPNPATRPATQPMNDYPTIQTVSTKPTDSFLQTVPRMPVHATTAPAPSRSHHLSASYARINHDAGSVRKAALTRLDANLGALKYQIYEAQMASDHRRVCQLRGERQRLVEQKTTLEHKEDTSNIAPNQQPTWDNILPMTHPSLLRKLKTIHEVEVVLMFINKNITRAEAKGHFTEAKRLECERDTTRKYLHEMRAGQQLVHAAGLEDMQLVQQATEPERPMNRYNLDLVRFNGEPVIEKRGSSPPTSSDPTEDMADAVAQVSRLIKKVTDIEKSISSRTKGGAIESLGTALLTNVRGLLAKTEALAGRIIDREKTTVGVKQPEEGL